MKLEEVISFLESVPIWSRNQVLAELENRNEVSALMAEEIREYWSREDDNANERCKEMRWAEAERGAFNLKGLV